MNKSQINFFCDRVSIVKHRVIKDHSNAFLPAEDLSIGQIASKIHSGEAPFRIELFENSNCPRPSGCSTRDFLEEFFAVPELDEIKSQRGERTRILRTIENRIATYAERLKEDFVMEEIADPRQALREFENKNFFTSYEMQVLGKIAVRNEEFDFERRKDVK